MSMETGKVLDARTGTLKRIGFVDDPAKRELIGQLSQKETRNLIELGDQVYREDSAGNLTEKKVGDIASRLNELFDFEDVNVERPGIIEKNKYIDGVLINEKSGEYHYFYADIPQSGSYEITNEITDKDIGLIMQGRRVEYNSEPAGICEVVLHGSDSELTKQPLITKFVRVTKMII